MIAKSTFLGISLAVFIAAVSAQADDAEPAVTPKAVIDAFAATSDGFSSDELLVRAELRDRFLKQLSPHRTLREDEERDALLTLLRLRKAGKLNRPTMRRGEAVDEAILPVSEIATRVVTDRHRITTDTLLADPRYRQELLFEAEKIRRGIDPDQLNKGVLSLRKKRALRPELVLQVAQWDRDVRTYSLAKLKVELATEKIPARPGVYLFRGATGYLYIGEAKNLARRLSEHLSGSDRVSLAEYLAGKDAAGVTVELHLFPPDSPARLTAIRRAYESELIRSRQPHFNVRP